MTKKKDSYSTSTLLYIGAITLFFAGIVSLPFAHQYAGISIALIAVGAISFAFIPIKRSKK